MKRILIPCFVFVMLVSLVGGAGAQDASTTDPASTLRVGITYDLYTSNPLRACGCGAEYEWMALQYDMLLNFDKNTLEPAPGIATEVPTVENGGISADGLTYTFTIRDDATWQDGEPVTARDVAFTYRFMLDNKIGAYDNYLPYDPTFETPNDTTFIWKQKQPSLAPIAPPYVPILPEHIWSRFDGDPKAAKEFENIPAIGSGPFQLVEWRRGSTSGWSRIRTTGEARRMSARSSSARSTTRRRWRSRSATVSWTSCPASLPTSRDRSRDRRTSVCTKLLGGGS